MDFHELIGQINIKKLLTSMLKKQQLGHAYAFTGERGRGKKTFANAFTKLLLCHEPQATSEVDIITPCGQCRSCLTFESGANPDFKVLEIEKDSIRIEEIRKMQQDIEIRPLYAQKRVYLIPEAQKMTKQAQNALLKTLEDPPAHTVILLTVPSMDALLETVRSRIYPLVLQKNSPAELAAMLEAKNLKDTDAGFVIAYADGNIGRAIQIASDRNFLSMREKIFELVKQLLNKDAEQQLSVSDVCSSYKSSIEEALELLTLFFRDVLALKMEVNPILLLNADKKEQLQALGKHLSKLDLMRWIDTIEKVRWGLASHVNVGLVLEYLELELTQS